MYGLSQETFTTFTGEKNYRTAGQIAEYNNRTYLPQWEAPCNNIVGASDGTKYGADIQEDEILYLYHRALCRTLPLVRYRKFIFTRRISIDYSNLNRNLMQKQSGPPTYSNQYLPTVPYKLLDDVFESGETNEKNKCYCRNGRCLPTGLIDLSPCFYGNFFSQCSVTTRLYKIITINYRDRQDSPLLYRIRISTKAIHRWSIDLRA